MNGTNTSSYPSGEIPEDEPLRTPPPRRRKALRHRFCEGIEAAVKAEPTAFGTTKPRTMMGLMVRELVGKAASARCDAIKAVMAYLDEAEQRRTAADIDSHEMSEPESLPEPRWDWSEDGAWDSSEREPEYLSEEEAKKKEEEERKVREEDMRAKLKAAFLRAAEADRLNEERKARLEAEKAGMNPPPAAPRPAPIPGNSPPSPPPDRRTIRIGGRIVER